MSAIDLITARLADRTRCPTLLQVKSGGDQKAAEAMALNKDVSVLVCPLSETADPVAAAAFLSSQRIVQTVGVIMALTYPGGFPQFEAAKAEIKAALRGWLISDQAGQVQYAGDQLLDYSPTKDGGRWLHMLRFRVPIHETYEAQT